MIEEDDLASRVLLAEMVECHAVMMLRCSYLCKDVLQDRGIIGNTITLGSEVFDANKLANVVVLVLRVSPADDFARTIEENGRFGERRDVSLGECPSGTAALVHVALAPRSNSGGSACEDCSTVGADSDWNIAELDVVEDQRAVELVACCRGLDEDGGIGNDCINDGLSTGRLTASSNSSSGDLESDLAPIESHSLIGPSCNYPSVASPSAYSEIKHTPVPGAVDARLSVVDGDVPYSESARY